MHFKSLVFITNSFIGIAPILSFVNETWNSQNQDISANSEWISIKTHKKFFYSDNDQFLHEDENLKISENIYDNKDGLFTIYAKKPQKKYFLKIRNINQSILNYFSKSKNIVNRTCHLISFIKNKFYNDQVIKRQLFARNFFLLLDTKDRGKINEDNPDVTFKSSWGVTNSSRVKNDFKFYITKKDLVNQIYLFEEKQYSDFINFHSVQDLEIWPVNFNFLPFVKIAKTPINHGTWKDKQIKMENITYDVPNYYMNEKKLLLPEGHDYGQHWIWGLLDALLIGSAIVGGGALGAALKNFGLSTVVSALISGIVSGVWPAWIQTIIDDYKSFEINRDKILENLKKIKQTILDNSAQNNVYTSFIDYPKKINQSLKIDKQWNKTIEVKIFGQLYGEGKSTSLFGNWSAMKVEQAWGLIEPHVDYNIYK